ncbi:MAG: tetratricopeptide repeat protein, partial [Nitrospinota bacterium]
PRGAGPELAAALEGFLRAHPRSPEEGLLRLQLAWALFRREDYAGAAQQAAAVSDAFALGRVYRLARVIEGLSLYHQGEVRRAYGVLRLGADQPPGGADRAEERGAARSAAMATAFAAFRLRDFAGAQAVLEHWAFGGGGAPADPEAALWYGEAAFEAGDLEGAGRAFASISGGAGEFLRGRAGLAWIHYRRGEWREAAGLFDKVMEGGPEGPLAAEALARAGEARYNLGDFAGAILAFERIESRYPGREVAREALRQKGKLLLRRGRAEEAAKAFALYLSAYPGSPGAEEVEYWSALVPFRRGEFEAAGARLLDYAERRPQSPLAGDAYLHAADASYNGGKYLQADRLYRLVMARFPDHPRHREAAYGLLLARLQREEFDAFVRDGRAFAGRYPDSPLSVALLFQVGEVHLTRGGLDEAHRAYRELAARYPDNELAAHALLRIGAIHRRRGSADAALDAYESLLARHPESRLRADALFGAGETLAGIARWAEAKGRFEEFLQRFPGHDFALLARFELGRAEARLGREREAIGHLGAVAAAPGPGGVRAQAGLLLAALRMKAGDLDGAERALGLALESGDPAVAAEALYSRAELMARRGDPAAPAEFLKLTYRHPDQTMWVARALARAGELYEKAGNRPTALRIFQKLRQVAPPGALREAAEEALRRLGGAPGARR